jgi:mannose-6-phosphate isomerase-like protein (cupin superfamily)
MVSQAMITDLQTIRTKGADGLPNGEVIPIWHIDSGQKIEQVYLLTIFRGCMKGPHLHHQREGAFTVVSGSVLIVYRVGSQYREVLCEDTYSGYATVRIPAGVPCALYNVGRETALVLNMPNPAWRDNSDEHPVDDWDFELPE